MSLFVSLSVSLIPVIVFLVVLILLDSYKLVRLRDVLAAILYGCVMAFVSLWVNSWLIGMLDVSTSSFQRYLAPTIEEVLKGTFIIYFIRRRRVGFMVDASIFGFAVGAGFAIVENIYYLKFFAGANLLLWILRGFGTAIMHGGVTALMAIISKQLSDRHPTVRGVVFVPGLVGAAIIHSAYNHFFLSPVLQTLGLLVVLPMIITAVFRASEGATRSWLGVRFDTDAELLEMINTGRVSESRIGEYLQSLKSRFAGEVVADMLCMLRLHLELSIRAKGILLMRETGFRVVPEPEIEEKFRELKYLERSIGKTGVLAVSPVFNMSDHDLWQLYMLGKK